jgi:hypothetical protein
MSLFLFRKKFYNALDDIAQRPQIPKRHPKYQGLAPPGLRQEPFHHRFALPNNARATILTSAGNTRANITKAKIV